uniref:Hexosyltransferase n=1 Tax=Sphaeramia orbicularis TaxID=375764 RepID=A0A673C242_9TELE
FQLFEMQQVFSSPYTLYLVFALSSDDNSEFWLSTDESPHNLQLLAWVGKTGREWTAPGEFEKYASQTSKPVRLSSQRRYFFEVIHKQNDKGTDHVEVAVSRYYMQISSPVFNDLRFHPTDESGLLMNDVAHIPQTVASHQQPPVRQNTATADMLREDPRDTLYHVPFINNKLLQGVLPDCSYKPSYIIKDFPLLRYQGLQFVHMSYIYPNDYTRLTHMETENSCYYFDSPHYMKFSKQLQMQRSRKMNLTQIQRLQDSKLQPSEREDRKPEKSTVGKQQRLVGREVELAATKSFTTSRRDANIPLGRLNQKEINRRKSLRDKEIERNMPLQLEGENRIGGDKIIETDVHSEDGRRGDDERDPFWGEDRDLEGDEEDTTPAPVFDTEVNWSQTFQVNHMDLQLQRSDWIDLRCNISGNLLLHPSDAQPMVKAFMDKLNQKHRGRFTLVRVVNVVKRVDGIQGSRYLLELQLKDVDGKLLRLSHYIYALIRHSRQRSKGFGFQRQQPQLVLCNPVGFRWNPIATVHFIVPVKNQARWVQQLITDMELLFRETGDSNFNLIITDYNSTDMDVRRALHKSSLPRYQYVKLSGNFERSAGLQAGVDLITDDHSIVFLCDLHIHFPLSIVDTIRKHCVEGYMAFAPIVMRLDCGATPLDAKGFWEVNGFGLLGIYKSDLEAVGGMNTREFKDRWGGEDWELLDRIFQAGLEVERIYLRNFFHHFHSKRGMWNRRVSSDHR